MRPATGTLCSQGNAHVQVCLPSTNVHVDRDQRWVLGCSRGPALGQPSHQECETCHRAAEPATIHHWEAMLHCTPRNTNPPHLLRAASLPRPSLCPRGALLYKQEALESTQNFQDSRELCTRGRNQRDHISPVHKAFFIARTDTTIHYNLVLPRCAVTHYQSVYQTFFFSLLCAPLRVPPTANT